MRVQLEEQLTVLNNEIVSMGALCESAITSVINALENIDINLAKKAIEIEKEIDQKEKNIETMCLRILLSQQPVAKDLRNVSASLKMITDMERIGDQAADIAEIILYEDVFENPLNDYISQMAQAVIKMVTESIDAFIKNDVKLAESVIKYDDVVDDLFAEVKKDVAKCIAKETSDNSLKMCGTAAVDILMIAKYMERLGDHATNIAEWVVFSITGEHVGEDL